MKINLKKLLNKLYKFEVNTLAEVYGCLAKRKKKMIKLLIKNKGFKIGAKQDIKHSLVKVWGKI